MDGFESRAFRQLEAAELLGVGARTFRCWCGWYEAAGEAGLRDRRLGQAAGNRVPAAAADPGQPAAGAPGAAAVKVRRYQDGSHALFHGPRCLGRYDAARIGLEEAVPQAA